MAISISATHVVFADTVNDKKSTIQENKVKYSQLDNESYFHLNYSSVKNLIMKLKI